MTGRTRIHNQQQNNSPRPFHGPFLLSHCGRHSTEMRFKLCTTWLSEFSSCSCLTVLPGPAWVLLNKFFKE